MADTRPFIDRRLGMVILFKRLDPGASLEAEEESTKEAFNGILDDSPYNVYVTDVMAKDNPPQEKIIFNESAMKPETLQDIASRFRSATEEVGGQVQTIQVQSLALSPGNKVRNALSMM